MKLYFVPKQLELRSICESWQIVYEPLKQQRVITKPTDNYELFLKGNIKNRTQYITCVQQWLKKKARRHIKNWIDAISTDLELPYSRLSIRGQRTRWGSCSEYKDISLNYKLLFLPAGLVEHIIAHELCHTVELNHSQRFWRLMEKFDENYKEKRRLLQEANQYLPNWVN